MSEAAEVWRRKTDGQLLTAADALADYTEEGERLIRAEFQRRGLPELPARIGTCPKCHRSINLSHPTDRCVQCDAPLPAELLARLTAQQAVAEGQPSADAGPMSASPRFGDIGGWLVLPAIGLVMGIVVSGWGLFGMLLNASLFPEVVAAGYGVLLAAELLVELGLFALFIYAATRFFRKKSNAPATMIGLLMVAVVANVLLVGSATSAGAEQAAQEYGTAAGRSIVSAVIWIPYFSSSKRVKATFIE